MKQPCKNQRTEKVKKSDPEEKRATKYKKPGEKKQKGLSDKCNMRKMTSEYSKKAKSCVPPNIKKFMFLMMKSGGIHCNFKKCKNCRKPF